MVQEPRHGLAMSYAQSLTVPRSVCWLGCALFWNSGFSSKLTCWQNSVSKSHHFLAEMIAPGLSQLLEATCSFSSKGTLSLGKLLLSKWAVSIHSSKQRQLVSLFNNHHCIFFNVKDINIDIVLLLNLKTLPNFTSGSTNVLFLLWEHMLHLVVMPQSPPGRFYHPLSFLS